MVGLRATIETSPGSQPTVVPLRVLATAATPGTAATVPYVAVFQTADDISKLYTTLVDEVDGKSNIVWRNREEPAGDYPSQMPIILKIPRSAAGKGSYLFTVKAQARSGFSPATVRFVHD
jgi:hypothetical protein